MRQRQGSGGTIPRLLLIVALLTALLAASGCATPTHDSLVLEEFIDRPRPGAGVLGP